MATLVIESVPEALHARLKRTAEAHQRSVNEETIHLLETALAGEKREQSTCVRESNWARRKLLPEYEALLRSGKLSGGTDSSIAISEDRDAR